jgi:hypothetical protein
VPAGFKPHLQPKRFTSRIKTGEPKIGYQEAIPELKRMMREVSPVYYLTQEGSPEPQVHGNKDGTILQKHAVHLRKKPKQSALPLRRLP